MISSPLPKEMHVSSKTKMGWPIYLGCFTADDKMAIVSGRHEQVLACAL